MTRLTRKGIRFVWNDACEHSFQELKKRLTSAPILVIPERGLGYIVYCDTSRDGLGYVLMQLSKVDCVWFMSVEDARTKLSDSRLRT